MSAISIAGRTIGPGHPVFVVAELSGNHHRDYDTAVRLIHAAKDAGADAVKTQCFTPDAMTLPLDSTPFRIQWQGQERTLYDLYAETAMPLEWHVPLKALAESLGLVYFASVFDRAGVDFCEQLEMPAYKIASFELTALPLIRFAASKGKPMILSTGMATKIEILKALLTAKNPAGRALLHCVSAYPTPIAEANVRKVANNWNAVSGISDHTLSIAVPVAAVTLGACIVEKHLTLSRAAGGPDAGFSLEPAEFRTMAEAIRTTEQALGEVRYGPTESEKPMLRLRRSLWVVADVQQGEPFTAENVRSLRPTGGLEPQYYWDIIGKRAARYCQRGEALTWGMVRGNDRA